MNITIRQLIIFETVARTESFTRAAEALHMTQPAISMQMKQLEAQTDLIIFERHGKKLVLNPCGREILLYAKKVLTEVHNMETALLELQNTDQHSIKVSAATTANHFITYMIANFSRIHQDVKVILDITNRASLMKQLNQYEPDLVVMGEPPKQLDQVYADIIMPNPLVMIAAINHPLVKEEIISLEAISNQVFIVREEGSGTKAAIKRHFNKYQCEFHSSFEMSSNEAIKNAVIAGLGLGIVSLHTIKIELEAKKLALLNVETLPIMRNWYLVSRTGKRLSRMAENFKTYIHQQADNYANEYPPVTVLIKK